MTVFWIIEIILLIFSWFMIYRIRTKKTKKKYDDSDEMVVYFLIVIVILTIPLVCFFTSFLSLFVLKGL